MGLIDLKVEYYVTSGGKYITLSLTVRVPFLPRPGDLIDLPGMDSLAYSDDMSLPEAVCLCWVATANHPLTLEPVLRIGSISEQQAEVVDLSYFTDQGWEIKG